MRVTFGKEKKHRTSVYIDEKEIGFIAITEIAHRPTEDDIIKAGDEWDESTHMWYFFDKRQDERYIRKDLRKLLVESDDDLGQSYFEKEVARRVVKVKAKVDKLSPKALDAVNKMIESFVFSQKGGQ